MKNTIYLLLLLVINLTSLNFLTAQQVKIDSLKLLLQSKNKIDTSFITQEAEIGDLFYYSGQTDSAIFYWERAKENTNHLLGKENSLESAFKLKKQNSVLYNDLAYLYVGKGKFNQAFDYYTKSIHYKQEINDIGGEIQGYSNLGHLYIQKGKMDSALFFNNIALKRAKENNLKDETAISAMQIAVIYTKLGLIERALDYLSMSEKLFKETNNLRGRAVVLNNIAKAYTDLEEYNTALKYFFESLELKYTEGDLPAIANAYNNIGAVYQKVNEPELANKYNKLALEYFKKNENKRGIATVLNNMGHIYTALNKLDSAKEVLNQSLAIRTEIKDQNGIAISLFNLAKIDYLEKDYFSAISKLKEAYKTAQETSDYSLLEDISYYLYLSYKKEKDFQQALKYHEDYVHYQALIFNKKNLKSAQRLQWEKNLNKTSSPSSPKKKKEATTISCNCTPPIAYFATFAMFILLMVLNFFLNNFTEMKP